MKRYGILGHPLAHTLSPYLHAELFRLSGRADCEYRIYDLPPETIAASKGVLRALDGYNVTIPYKIDALRFADRLSPEAERFGAVNCLAKKDGETVGYNTDAFGFIRAVEEIPAELDGRVLLLGAGGAGQMMAVAAAERGAKLTIAVREGSLAKAEALKRRAEQFGGAVEATALENIRGEFDLLLNATPVGMIPNPNRSPVGERVVARCGAVFDAVYNPKETLLYKTAVKLGIPAATGTSMLVYQALKAHEIWYGGRFLKEDIAALVERVSEREV